MIYLDNNAVSKLRRMLAGFFHEIALIDYEMFNGKDSFGKVMVRNFEVS